MRMFFSRRIIFHPTYPVLLHRHADVTLSFQYFDLSFHSPTILVHPLASLRNSLADFPPSPTILVDFLLASLLTDPQRLRRNLSRQDSLGLRCEKTGGAGVRKTLEVDAVIGADGANSRVAKSIDTGDSSTPLHFRHYLVIIQLLAGSRSNHSESRSVLTQLQFSKYCRRLVHYLLSKGSLLVVLGVLLAGVGLYLATSEGLYAKLQHIKELLQYSQFVLWWIALGVASSIGLGEDSEPIKLGEAEFVEEGGIDLRYLATHKVSINLSSQCLREVIKTFAAKFHHVLMMVKSDSIIWHHISEHLVHSQENGDCIIEGVEPGDISYLLIEWRDPLFLMFASWLVQDVHIFNLDDSNWRNWILFTFKISEKTSFLYMFRGSDSMLLFSL